ncbi:POTRA domain-containing protein [Fusobacterium ulcerans]|jgi:hemolysin activation/secretion protein|nr:POTRA domain-containing protein [Fusobacterium ulcerans]
MKWKIVFIGFFVLSSISFSNSEEINREERRRHEEEIRKLEKAEAKDEIQLNELEENIEAIGDEIKSLEISGNTILKASEIEVLKKKYIGKIGGKNILNLMRELENLYLVKGYIAVRVKMDMDKADIPEGKIALKVLEGYIEE